MNEGTEAALTTAFRDEWPRLIAAALRITGDLQMAEDVTQDALLAALDRWPLQGIPDRPGAWLMTACRNRARNLVRDTRRAQQRLVSLRPLLDEPPPADGETPQILDDRLRLIAMCCHPLLATDAQVSLTLRMVAGLTTQEIARGFNLPTTSIAQRIVRAKRALRQHRVAFDADDPDIHARLASILDVIYLIFNEGYLPAEGDILTRGDLAFEARRLACLLTSLIPAEPDPWALRALLSFQLSRWATRTAPDGALLAAPRLRSPTMTRHSNWSATRPNAGTLPKPAGEPRRLPCPPRTQAEERLSYQCHTPSTPSPSAGRSTKSSTTSPTAPTTANGAPGS